jgi:hypothetical protein
MAVTLNASTSSGLVSTADTSGIITLQNNGTNALTVTSGNLQFNSGYGSVATAYGCRAWINFNGTGTPAIRASGNVTSITDNGTGDYTLNFTTAMPDINYSMAGMARSAGRMVCIGAAPTTSGLRIQTANDAGNLEDNDTVTVAFFR